MKNKSLVFKWSLIVALGGFLFGFDTAVISGVERSIQELFDLDSFWHGSPLPVLFFGQESLNSLIDFAINTF